MGTQQMGDAIRVQRNRKRGRGLNGGKRKEGRHLRPYTAHGVRSTTCMGEKRRKERRFALSGSEPVQ